MPANKSRDAAQSTISSFFSPSPKKSKRAFDLTGDSDEERPVKKLKSSVPNHTSFDSPTSSTSIGAASQWRFTPASLDMITTTPKPRTESEIVATRERREAFKKRLLLENNQFLGKQSENASETIDLVDTDTSGEDSDQAFKELSFMFSNKGKGKGKAAKAPATRKPKNPPLLGPSGNSYTPLENQVMWWLW